GRLARFYVPFALCFVVPNLFQLSPWIWDNIKFLVYWLAASTPIVALLLAHWWRRGAWRSAAAVALVLLTLAGSLDVWRVVSRAGPPRRRRLRDVRTRGSGHGGRGRLGRIAAGPVVRALPALRRAPRRKMT